MLACVYTRAHFKHIHKHIHTFKHIRGSVELGYNYAQEMDDAEPLEHIHVQEHQDRFDDHEDEQDGGDDSDNPERVKLNSIEYRSTKAGRGTGRNRRNLQ